MGGTYCIGSDRYAVTVVRLQGTTIVWTRWDKHKRTDRNGQSEDQWYVHVPNPDGHLQKFTLRRDGAWREARGAGRLYLGERDTYQDPSF